MPFDHPRRCDHSRTPAGSQTDLYAAAALSSIPVCGRARPDDIPRGKRRRRWPGGDPAPGSGEDAHAETRPAVRTRNATLMASIRSSNYLAPETDSRRWRACAVPAAITWRNGGQKGSVADEVVSYQSRRRYTTATNSCCETIAVACMKQSRRVAFVTSQLPEVHAGQRLLNEISSGASKLSACHCFHLLLSW